MCINLLVAGGNSKIVRGTVVLSVLLPRLVSPALPWRGCSSPPVVSPFHWDTAAFRHSQVSAADPPAMERVSFLDECGFLTFHSSLVFVTHLCTANVILD